MEYPFEQLPIDVDGDLVGEFNGSAILSPDGDEGEFWIPELHLDTAGGESIKLTLDGSTLRRQLFLAITAALYDDPDVRDAWAAHLDDEAADDHPAPSPAMAAARFVMFGVRP